MVIPLKPFNSVRIFDRLSFSKKESEKDTLYTIRRSKAYHIFRTLPENEQDLYDELADQDKLRYEKQMDLFRDGKFTQEMKENTY